MSQGDKVNLSGELYIFILLFVFFCSAFVKKRLEKVHLILILNQPSPRMCRITVVVLSGLAVQYQCAITVQIETEVG